MAGTFNVFFSYSTRDHAVAGRVARALTECALRVFLDPCHLSPGQPWPQALEQTLDACNAVAVFVGAEGLGRWQQRERDLALCRRALKPASPVLLTSTDPGLGCLRLNTRVDLCGGDDADALAILTAAIRGGPPGPQGPQQSNAARADVCPYRESWPYCEEEEPFFFGRAGSSETLTAVMLRRPFVAILGASGSAAGRNGLLVYSDQCLQLMPKGYTSRYPSCYPKLPRPTGELTESRSTEITQPFSGSALRCDRQGVMAPCF